MSENIKNLKGVKKQNLEDIDKLEQKEFKSRDRNKLEKNNFNLNQEVFDIERKVDAIQDSILSLAKQKGFELEVEELKS